MRNKTSVKVIAITLTAILCTVAILSAVFPLPEGTIAFLSIGTTHKVSANPDWLSGYDYRQQITINGTSVGAQTNYQMMLTAYKVAAPFANNGRSPLAGPENYPQVYYYNGTTYVCWEGDIGLDPYVDCYNHTSGTWHGPVKVGTNPLEDDTHGSPAIIVDDSGYIHVFYGCHGSGGDAAIKYTKSTNTEDIDTWSAQSDIGSGKLPSYPNVVKDDGGTLWLFFRGGTSGNKLYEEFYVKSSDWGTYYKVIETDQNDDRIYHGNADYDSTNDRIHLAWTYWDESDGGSQKWFNIYHAYLYIGATDGQTQGNLYSMGGIDLGTSITTAEADSYCEIYDSGTGRCQVPSLHLDSNKYPYVMFPSGTDATPSTWYTKFIRWNGSSWESAVNVVNCQHYANSQDFIVNSSTDIDAYIAVSTTGEWSGDIEKWHWNGSTWSKTKTVLYESNVYYVGLNYPHLAVGGTSTLRFIFTDYQTDSECDTRLYATNSDDEFLGAQDTVQLNSHCQDDFDDVRFTQSDGTTELDYWCEEYVSAKHATFWVEFNSIPASPSSTNFYTYYDNSGASSGSNGTNTFPSLFDHFDGGSLNGDIWDSSGSVSVADSIVTIEDANGEIYSDTSFGSGCAVRGYGILDDNYSNGETTIGFNNDIQDTNNIEIYSYAIDEVNCCFTMKDSSYSYSNMEEPKSTSNRTFDVMWPSSSLARFRIDVGCVKELTTNIPTGSYPINVFTRQSTDIAEFDWILLRKYVYPQPTWGAWGTEEGFSLEITNTPSSNDFGILEVASTGNTAIDYFTITNTGNCAVDVTVQGTDATGSGSGWVSPTGHDDPDSHWNDEAEAYDENTSSGNGAWGFYQDYYLWLTLGSAISCDKVRFWPYEASGTPDMAVDVYYSGAWHNIHDGELNNDQWNEISIGSTQSVDKARICNREIGTHYVTEFDFNSASYSWTLSDTATPAENVYGLYAGLDDEDDNFDVIVRKTATYNTLVSDLAEDATQDWGLKIYMPTSLSGYECQEMSATITLVASEAS